MGVFQCGHEDTSSLEEKLTSLISILEQRCKIYGKPLCFYKFSRSLRELKNLFFHF